jgi:hypothetical protein
VRIGALRNGFFDPLVGKGGSLLQRRSIKEDAPTCPVEGEQVPPEAIFVSRRITTLVLGAGLREAIPEEEIMKRAALNDRNRDGISGAPNRVINSESGEVEVGRFGWKAHVPTLHLFSGDAYLNEMGINNSTFSGDYPVAALRRKPIHLYLFSDLLLHDLGPDLADGIEMGLAMGNERRTTPLGGCRIGSFSSTTGAPAPSKPPSSFTAARRRRRATASCGSSARSARRCGRFCALCSLRV